MKIIPSRQYQNITEENLLRRLMLLILEIKINYIYLHRSPLKKFTIFSLHNAPLACTFSVEVMSDVFVWKMINEKFSLESLTFDGREASGIDMQKCF